MTHITLPSNFTVYINIQNKLVIMENTKEAIIDLNSLTIERNELGKKLILEAIVRELSWTPPEPMNRLIWNPKTETKRRKRARRNTIETQEQEITMLRFIKPKK